MGLAGRLRAVITKPAAPSRADLVGQPAPAPALQGVDAVTGEPVAVDVTEGRHTLLFLTSACRPCRDLWASAGADAVVITPSPTTESRRAVARLAGATTKVVMSSDVWTAYSVTKAPWRVALIDGVVKEDAPADGD